MGSGDERVVAAGSCGRVQARQRDYIERGNMGRANIETNNIERGNMGRGNIERGNVERSSVRATWECLLEQIRQLHVVSFEERAQLFPRGARRFAVKAPPLSVNDLRDSTSRWSKLHPSVSTICATEPAGCVQGVLGQGSLWPTAQVHACSAMCYPESLKSLIVAMMWIALKTMGAACACVHAQHSPTFSSGVHIIATMNDFSDSGQLSLLAEKIEWRLVMRCR